jgi:hypothetical protein
MKNYLCVSSIAMYMKNSNSILTHCRQSTFTLETEDKRRSEQHTSLQKLEIRTTIVTKITKFTRRFSTTRALGMHWASLLHFSRKLSMCKISTLEYSSPLRYYVVTSTLPVHNYITYGCKLFPRAAVTYSES